MRLGRHSIFRRGTRTVDLGGSKRVNPQRLGGVWLDLGGLGLRPTRWQSEKREERREKRKQETAIVTYS